MRTGAAKTREPAGKSVETITHAADTRRNIPTAVLQAVVAETHGTPVRVAYERRNRDLDPQLVWRGKDEQDWSDLIVPAPPLSIQEKVRGRHLFPGATISCGRSSTTSRPPACSRRTRATSSPSGRCRHGRGISCVPKAAMPMMRRERAAAIFIGPEYGTVSRNDLSAAAREALEAGFDLLVACGFNFEAVATEFSRLGPLPILKARMNADLHMADDLPPRARCRRAGVVRFS